MDRIRRTIARGIVCAVVVLCCTSALSGVEFAGGTGEPNDPYQIATAEQLISLGSDPNLFDKHFILIADIDLDPNLPGGRVFDGPVVAGGQEWPDVVDPNFVGTVDGRGFRVRNLTIQARTGGTGALGLFGRIGKAGRVANLAVENATIRGDVQNAATGALVGINWGVVKACCARGSVTGGDMVGGLCGENCGEIRSCYSEASVSGRRYVGGLVGYDRVPLRGRFAPVIINSYSSGAVSGQQDVRGLVGTERAWVRYSFWDVQTSGQMTEGPGIGLMTFQMMDAVVFAAHGWDQDPNWVMDDGRDYPRLVWEGTMDSPIVGQPSDRFEGSGSPRDPYHIGTAEQFALIGLVPSLSEGHFVLDTDLDLAGMLLQPIDSFNGFFHGNRHVLRHLTVQIGGTSTAAAEFSGAVFGTIGPGGRVSCLGLEDASIVVRTVVAAGSHAVGVLAAVNEGVVTGCYAAGAVDASQSQSSIGLIGRNSGVLARSYARLDVAGSNWTGGLVASNYAPSGLNNSTSFPARTTYSTLILECYLAQTVPMGSTKGTWVGRNDGWVLNSYFLSEPEESLPDGIAYPLVLAGSSTSGVGTPLTDSQMRQQDSFVGWGFAGSCGDGTADRWHMPDADYPVLAWQVDWEGLRPVPDIADLPLDWARTELELAGFVVRDILYDYHSAIPKKRAILTSPVGLAPLGSVVDIIASQGVYTLSDADSWGTYDTSVPFIRIETPGLVESLVGRNLLVDVTILLARDIDMTGWDLLPIPPASLSPLFQGTLSGGVFLGGGHRISHLRNYRSGGFFHYIGADGFVHGLCLDDVLVFCPDATSEGALAAVNHGVVLQCAVTGLVLGSGSAWDVGGVVGWNWGLIERCSVDAVVRNSQTETSDPNAEPGRTGGVAAYNVRGTIVDSYVRGEVLGLGYTGGLVGINDGEVRDCYSAASVAGQARDVTGGLAGYVVPKGIPCSTRTGTITTPPTTPIDCYFLGVADGGGPDNGWGTQLTMSQMQQQASFAGWDFESTWMICEGLDYPRLQWEGVDCNSVTMTGGEL
ncbi:MAG TPA: PASTA domain-containing protein [Sedimentisphaerales bacterium]|jgi:hypothetical protein|nr:PASTA domain-containing protein [Sedimentisphaerales bacterium]HNU30193.1 PASTA domain-containing protein [Sedimentisphaerales bacterium]